MFHSNHKWRFPARRFSTITFFVFTASYFYFQEIKAVSSSTEHPKYILLWTRQDYFPFSEMGEGRSVFVEKGCPQVNCYVTSDRTLFQGDLTKFDAVGFNGRNIADMDERQLPAERSPHQRYIYFNLESAHNCPVCNKIYDNFFNWTATYRLDSYIPLRYILIKNSAGDNVGPKRNMEWMNKTYLTKKTYEEFHSKVIRKSKAAAWFVSNCKDKKHRIDFAKQLQKSMDLYNLKIDIYGNCGTKTCRRGNPECDVMLENEYYFYLSFENSCSEDYVTEKLLIAVNHFTIPIVYGCADYSRFLPPFSYIDGNTMSAADIAALMHRLIQSPNLYLEYMWWRDHYTYHWAFYKDICNVCSALHNETMLEKQSVYKDYRKWWYSDYENECVSEGFRFS